MKRCSFSASSLRAHSLLQENKKRRRGCDEHHHDGAAGSSAMGHRPLVRLSPHPGRRGDGAVDVEAPVIRPLLLSLGFVLLASLPGCGPEARGTGQGVGSSEVIVPLASSPVPLASENGTGSASASVAGQNNGREATPLASSPAPLFSSSPTGSPRNSPRPMRRCG